MTLYAYGAAVTRSARPSGIDGAAVRMVVCDGLLVAVSSHADGDLSPTRARLEAHNAVNMSLVEAGGVVPFRFGNTFLDEPDLRAKLAPRAGALREKLAELAGCCELTARVDHSEDPLPGGAGTRYLRGKQRLFANGKALRERLGALVKDTREELGDGALRLAVLVRFDDVPAVKALARLSGPWPPSSFV